MSILDIIRFKEKANDPRKERENCDKGSMCSEMWPQVNAIIDQNLAGNRINVLFIF